MYICEKYVKKKNSFSSSGSGEEEGGGSEKGRQWQACICQMCQCLLWRGMCIMSGEIDVWEEETEEEEGEVEEESMAGMA